MHALLNSILQLRFSNIGDTMLHFIRRDMQRIEQQIQQEPSIHRLSIRYYPIGSTTLCMTYEKEYGFHYRLWNTARKLQLTATTLEDARLHALFFLDMKHHCNPLHHTIHPITVRLGWGWGGGWTYPKKLFRVVWMRNR